MKYLRCKKTILISVTIVIPFILLELSYRFIIPYFYHKSDYADNQVVSYKYDPVLGWSGIPGVTGWDYTGYNPVKIVNNSKGFRDIEHDVSNPMPAIVFLGGSFVWGFDIKTENMFVNLLRRRLPNYDIFNLSNICYGIDQDLLTFENWQKNFNGQIQLVIIVFTAEDVERVGRTIDCDKGKPKFEIVNDELVLTGVPVPKKADWKGKKKDTVPKTTEKQINDMTWKARFREFILNSYFLRAMYNRYAILRNMDKSVENREDGIILTRYQPNKDDLILISKILEKIDNITRARDGKLIVYFAPSYLEMKNDLNYHPYQQEIINSCEKLGIRCFDLAPALKKTRWKAYVENGLHWNDYGQKLAAKAMYDEILNEECQSQFSN